MWGTRWVVKDVFSICNMSSSPGLKKSYKIRHHAGRGTTAASGTPVQGGDIIEDLIEDIVTLGVMQVFATVKLELLEMQMMVDKGYVLCRMSCRDVNL